MNEANKPTDSIAEVAKRARVAGRSVAALSAEARNAILVAVADAIEENSPKIIAANRLDCDRAAGEVAAGRMSGAFFDRLQTSERGIADMAAKVQAVSKLPDLLGQTLEETELAEHLTLRKVSCPLGVVGIVFESRPDVVPQVSALCLKSGNAVILKGG